jgi:predicted nucleotide-binding protein
MSPDFNGQLGKLRETVNLAQVRFLDEIWDHFRSSQEWPTTRSVHSRRERPKIKGLIQNLGGDIIREGSNSGEKVYELTLIGVFLTSLGVEYFDLYVRCFEFLRDEFLSNPKKLNFTEKEVSLALRLTEEETLSLGLIIRCGGILNGGYGPSPTWYARSSEIIEEMPRTGRLIESVEAHIFMRFNHAAPLFFEERWSLGFQQPSLAITQETTNSFTPPPNESNQGECDRRCVFVVHGRNEKLRMAMFQLLRALDLAPLEWGQAMNETGETSPFIWEVIEAGFKKAQAIVVILSPDDEARLKNEFLTQSDPADEKDLIGQPRPNVLFEAGFAFGRNASRTILVQFGRLRGFSDIGGRHILRMNNSPEARQDLARRLQTAGCKLNQTGKDWLKIGDFSTTEEERTEQLQQPRKEQSKSDSPRPNTEVMAPPNGHLMASKNLISVECVDLCKEYSAAPPLRSHLVKDKYIGKWVRWSGALTSASRDKLEPDYCDLTFHPSVGLHFLLGKDQLKDEEIENFLKKNFESFYSSHRIPVDPPKGTYQFVAQCGISGTILGPPSYHDYQNKLRKLHQERFSRMPFEMFKSRIRIVRDELVVKSWLDEQSFRTEYTSLNTPEAIKFSNRNEVEAHFKSNFKNLVGHGGIKSIEIRCRVRPVDFPYLEHVKLGTVISMIGQIKDLDQSRVNITNVLLERK